MDNGSLFFALFAPAALLLTIAVIGFAQWLVRGAVLGIVALVREARRRHSGGARAGDRRAISDVGSPE